MIGDKTYISIGDFIDLYYKVKQKGYNELLSKFHLSNKGRTLSKWNTISSSSDFWIIPEIRCRWNEKCTGNPNIEYEDYVVSKYFSKSKGLKMLSVGCGTGARERKFAKYPNFNLIEGVDMSEKQIDEARNHASDLKLNNIKYIVGDFTTHIFEHSTYDVILFNSSLHHFKDIHNILQTKVLPLLKDGGYLLIFEYVGPKRLQWTKQQLEFANKLLTDLPLKYKIRFNSKSIKRRIYRPGLFRMLLVDPSEAIDSDSIIPSIHNHFKIIEERKIGWDISHLLFKDIAHNFLNNDKETQKLLSYLFEKEDEYLSMTGGSDAVFGVYQK
ncbi:MAG TPA: methyltransferase domain-containing protein [Prolixibacteraceae bacterium]|nr:methyltransferase domain-containing protein [Prolixibacteraceae bacterium]